jgi:hypothetical protein
MNERMQDRLFSACGVASVALALAGSGIATVAGKTHNLTVSSTTAQITHALAKPAGTGVWIGAYAELLGVGAFLAFAVWASAKLGGGLLGAIARAAGTGYATLTLASLGLMAAIAYRAGHGMDVQLGRTLVTINEALYVCTWFLSAFFLLAAGSLALTAHRRALGASAIGVAVVTLVGAAVSFNDLGQLSVLLWFAWTIYASLALTRGEHTRARSVAASTVQHA